MAGTTFYVGEQPSEPLVITVTDPTGAPRDLSQYTSIAFIGQQPLPAGAAGINDAAQGKVQYDFAEPFSDADVLTLQVKMTTVSGDVDFSEPFSIEVLDVTDTTTTIVSATQVEIYTGTSVSQSNLVKAQGLIMLATARDLTDQEFVSSLSQGDLFWLRLAIAYQSSDLARNDASDVQIPYAPGVQSMSTGDQSITYSTATSGAPQLPSLCAESLLALKRLSWMQPRRTVHALPFLTTNWKPSMWSTVYQASQAGRI